MAALESSLRETLAELVDLIVQLHGQVDQLRAEQAPRKVFGRSIHQAPRVDGLFDKQGWDLPPALGHDTCGSLWRRPGLV